MKNRLPLAAAYYLAPAILVSIALVQQYRARVYGQSAWIGCGFGMFATLDNEVTRFVHAKLIGADGAKPLAIPQSFEPELARVNAIPSQANLRRLAVRMLSECVERKRGQSLQLSIMRVHFDPESNRLETTPIQSVNVR